jgi:predicted nucleic acid-binding protein
MILVDTSILIDFFRGSINEKTQKFEIILRQRIPFGIHSIIFQEVLQGAKSDQEYERLKRYLSSQRFYPSRHPVESYAAAAKIYRDCRKKGITVRSTIDCLIAQTAIENDLFLLHNDSDFDAIAGIVPLKIY